MRKYKCNPPKTGWYLAWFNGVFLNIGDDPLDERNAFYWTGEVWKNHEWFNTLLFSKNYRETDRWSYLPKDHPKKEKKPSRKKVDLYI